VGIPAWSGNHADLGRGCSSAVPTLAHLPHVAMSMAGQERSRTIGAFVLTLSMFISNCSMLLPLSSALLPLLFSSSFAIAVVECRSERLYFSGGLDNVTYPVCLAAAWTGRKEPETARLALAQFAPTRHTHATKYSGT